MNPLSAEAPLCHGNLDTLHMPGHWLLARLGKRVLRPGGRELTERLLAALAVGRADDVVELAPGAGATARQVLACQPRSYVAVDRDEEVVQRLQGWLAGPGADVRLGVAHETGLAAGAATVVLGEAMLTMNAAAMKQRIVAEAFRLLAPGGRYGIHELCLTPDDLSPASQREIARDLSASIHVGAQPLPVGAWWALLEEAGFVVEATFEAPMHLLEPGRFLQDEGVAGAARFAWNLARDRDARTRVLEMRRIFQRHARHLGAIALVARKP
jgi:hypothetical protein